MVAADWQVLRPQPRGIAGSSGPMEGVGLGDLARDVACVIRAHGEAPAVVLGHAFGTFVARALADDHSGFDPFKPQALWTELQQGAEDRVTTVIVDDASHALFPEQPDRVAVAVLKWAAICDLRQ